MPKSRGSGSFLSVAKSRRTPTSENITSAGSSGVSRPSSVAKRQAALRVTARPFGGAVGDFLDLAFQNLVPARQRKRYHSRTCSASLQDATGNVVSKNHSSASPPRSSSSLT